MRIEAQQEVTIDSHSIRFHDSLFRSGYEFPVYIEPFRTELSTSKL